MKRVFGLAAVALLVTAVAVGGYLKFGVRQVAAQTTGPTATVTRGTLAATVNAAGNITPRQSVALNFGQAGTVQKVNVQTGDSVKSGQVLATLDTTDLQLQLQNAQVNLKLAQDKLAQAKDPTTPQDIANARAQVQAAQANYDKLAAGPTAADLAAAQAAVASAQAAYDSAQKAATTTNSQLEAAAATVQKAQAALQAAQAAYDRVSSQPNVGMLSQSVTLQQDTIDYQSALANYQSLQATAQSDANAKVQQALASLQQAQANLAKAKTPATAQDLTASKAQVTEAQNSLDKLLAGPDAASLDIAQQGVTQAQIALQQAQLKLQQAQVVAPFDGVVTAVNIVSGQAAPTSGSTGAIQLADLSHLEIVVNLAEVDVNKIQPGQPAQITLDALPNANLQGKVTEVAPAGVQTQGVVNYPVTVELQNPPAGVKTGMTANVNVVVAQKANVLMVPNRAVKTQGRQKVVTVLFEGQQIQTPVNTGLSNDTMTEITSGLNEGDTVLLSTTTTAAPRTGAAGLGGFVGPGGPGR